MEAGSLLAVTATLRVTEGNCPWVVRQQAKRLGWTVVQVDQYAESVGEYFACSSAGKQQSRRVTKKNERDSGKIVLSWKTGRFFKSEYTKCQGAGHRMNHFPHSGRITKKDLLLRHLRQLKAVYGGVYGSFMPQAFLLPSEYTKFLQQYAADEEEGKSGVWICKPTDLSRGRKIFLIRNLCELRYDQQCVLQKYVPNPLTVGGYKVDLRVYALVTSVHPLRVYVYNDGLARFGTEKYDQNDLDNLYAHLTNTSINKFSESYKKDKDVIGSGAKWDFRQLREWINNDDIAASESNESNNISSCNNTNESRFEMLWQRICDIVTLTVLAIVPEKNNDPQSSFFELFGFDILTDERLKPYLLEVNCAPSLSINCEEDARVKELLVRDLLKLVQAENMHMKRRQVAKRETSKSSIAATATARRHRYLQRRKPPISSTLRMPISHADSSIVKGGASETSHVDCERIEEDEQDMEEKKTALESKTACRGNAVEEDTEQCGYMGNFKLVFPFDSVSSKASDALHRESIKPNPSAQAFTAHIRTIVSQIKKRRIFVCRPPFNK